MAACWATAAAASPAHLCEAVRTGDSDAVAALLAPGADPNAATPTGETALHEAARRDDLALAGRLLAAGASVRDNRFGISPLILACVNGSAEMIDLLLKAGGDFCRTTPDGSTPLMIAAKTGRPAAVRLLVSQGAEVNAREHGRGQTALMWAAAEGHVEAVRSLVEGGAVVDARSKGGFSALHFAARQGQIDVARELLARGANPNGGIGEDGSGASALALAVTNCHFELGAVLLDGGADPNYTWEGRTVLHILTWVTRPGTGTNNPAPEGSGRLSRLDLLRELHRHGADINRRMTQRKAGVRTVLNMKGATPFLLAARTADAPMMRLLAELGADPTLPNEDGTTPLMVAAGIGTHAAEEDPGTTEEVLEAVKVAVELGNDINAVDARGETAMHGAAYKYAAPVVSYLVQHGARIDVWNSKNHLGWTPLRIATGVHRTMNLRRSPETAAALREIMLAAGVSIELDPETNINGDTI